MNTGKVDVPGAGPGAQKDPAPATAPLRIGFVEGVTLTKWRRIWADRFRRDRLEVLAVEEEQQRAVLIEDTVDMCFVRLPLDVEGLHAISLYEEQPVVWLSKDHVLAELDELTADDLADTRVLRDASAESIELATYSAAVLRVPLSVARGGSRKDLVHRPAPDEPPTTVALAWRTDNQHPLIDEFIGIVRGRSATSSRTQAERDKADAVKPPGKRPPTPERKARPSVTRATQSRRRGRR